MTVGHSACAWDGWGLDDFWRLMLRPCGGSSKLTHYWCFVVSVLFPDSLLELLEVRLLFVTGFQFYSRPWCVCMCRSCASRPQHGV